jgi:hypothetical protein
VAEISLPAGQTQGKLVIEAAKDTPPGKHTLSVTAVSKFNGQDLSISEDVAVTVEAAEAK